MIAALAAAVLFAVPVQDETDRLRDAWPKLVEAWKAVEQHKPAKTSKLDDGFIRLMGDLHDAFQAAGFFEKELGFEAASFKQLFKARAEKVLPKSGASVHGNFIQLHDWHSGQKKSPSFGMSTLLASIQKLQDLKKKGLDDEDNIADEMTMVRKSLKGMGLTADETPMWLRRRLVKLTTAVVLGQACPERAKATAEQKAQFEGWIEQLGAGNIDDREAAMRKLMNAGEAALPQLRDALKDEDPEVTERVKKIIGVGHNPWKTSMKENNKMRVGNAWIIEKARGIMEIEPADDK